MTTQLNDLREQLRKLRMDLTNAQSKLTSIIAVFGEDDFAPPERLSSFEQIRRQIANGTLTDTVDLEAEANAHGLTPAQHAELAHLLPG